MEANQILIADDEPKMREILRAYLRKAGFAVDEAGHGKQVLEKVKSGPYHLVVLDLMMPELDGWATCREIRRFSDIPILMLTARGEESERVLGFELGADDYVVKPFSPQELVMRVKALTRRAPMYQGLLRDTVTQGGLVIDRRARRVSLDGQEIDLSRREFDLLYFLATRPGQVFTREELLEQVWGFDFFGTLRTVDTHVRTLREKLERGGQAAEYIKTVWGVGYKFQEPRPGEGQAQ